MIFVSLGTHEQAFDRALTLIEPLTKQGYELVVQCGVTSPRPGWPLTAWYEYLTSDEVRSFIASADAFICHAGVGSILTGLMSGKRPIVVAREKRQHEHVDDHQVELAAQMQSRGLVLVLKNGDDPGVAVMSVALSDGQVVPSSKMIATVRRAIDR